MNKDNSLRVKKITLVDAVIEQMLEAVKSGRFQPGNKIPSEKVLAQEFGVSRTTLREAFKRLESAGALAIKQGDGTYLLNNCDNLDFGEDAEKPAEEPEEPTALSDEVQRQISKVFSIRNHRLSHYVEAREILEVSVVELAAERATAEDLRALRENLDAQSRALGDPILFYQLDCAFHHLLVEAAKNILLLEFWMLLLPFMQEQMAKVQGVAENAFHNHQLLYRAIAGKDIEAAKQLIVEHMRIVPGRMLFGTYGTTTD